MRAPHPAGSGIPYTPIDAGTAVPLLAEGGSSLCTAACGTACSEEKMQAFTEPVQHHTAEVT